MSPRASDTQWLDLPAKVEAVFAREAEGFDRYLLGLLYRALSGEPIDFEKPGLPDFLEREFGVTTESLARIAPIYANAVGDAKQAASPLPTEIASVDYAKRALKPGTLDAAIDQLGGSPFVRIAAKKIARALRGSPLPEGEELDALLERIGVSSAAALYDHKQRACDLYLAALVHYRDSSSARSWRHGFRRRQQVQKMSLVLPYALARRLPLVFNNQFEGVIEGEDQYGPISCSEPLRSGAVGLLGYLLGIASHPDRFSGYNQIDEQGRVLTSQTRIYQTLAAVKRESEPGGGGHHSVVSWIDQVASLEFSAGVRDWKPNPKYGRSSNLLAPSSPVESVEKLVDADESTEWVSWDDPRSPTKRAELTLRFALAKWCVDRIGTAGEAGDRVYFDASVWRCLSPAARAMYLETQGRRARKSEKTRFNYVEFYAANPWALRFGMTHLSDKKRESIILAAFAELYRVDKRVKGYAKPWHANNSTAKTFRIYVDGRSSPTEQMRMRIKRADFEIQLELHAAGGQWPGRLSSSAAANAPPDI